uniref:Zf-C2HC5 domain-containing protein n=1 Tax=Steinernema glaseri TaxID=37863 RepID=A0A1I8ACF5_9BILA
MVKKKVGSVTMAADPTANPAAKVSKSRIKCDCQARVHDLILNCLNCGRIVCAQEGSGPCFFCGELVVSRAEREILENGSNTQRKKLMMTLTGKSGEASLSSMSEDFQRAQAFRDNLLRADADTEKQKEVADLDSDYHNIEQSSHLTAEEREAIIRRKEELVELDKARQKQVIVSISATGEVTEQKQARMTAATDPIIRAIVQKSLNRKQTVANTRKARPADDSFNVKDFTPYYDKAHGEKVDKKANERNREMLKRDEILLQANEEILYSEVEKEGYCMVFDQPYATVALTEDVGYLPWHEETTFRGPAFLAASMRIPVDKDLEVVADIYGLKKMPKASDLDIGAILGRIVVDQCWRTVDFVEMMNEKDKTGRKKKPTITSPFVLLVSNPRCLDTPVSHVPTGKFFKLDDQLKAITREQFGAYV